VMASPGMLQSGLSRELFEMWCTDKRNGVIIPGYSVEGTLAKHILSEPATITTSAGQVVPLHMSVHYISFSAHSDFLQTSEYIDTLKPPQVVLVHGDSNEMSRLAQSLTHKYEDQNVSVHTPKNGVKVELEFKAEKIAKIVGSLATTPPSVGHVVGGVMIVKDFQHTLLQPQDMNLYTALPTSSITQRLLVPFYASWYVLVTQLSDMYGNEEIQEQQNTDKENSQIKVCETVSVSYIASTPCHLVMTWDSNVTNDMIADSIIALAMQLQSTPRSQPASPKT